MTVDRLGIFDAGPHDRRCPFTSPADDHGPIAELNAIGHDTFAGDTSDIDMAYKSEQPGIVHDPPAR
jgi:hypothetical protein